MLPTETISPIQSFLQKYFLITLILLSSEMLLAQTIADKLLVEDVYDVGFQYFYKLDESRKWEPFPFDIKTEHPRADVRPIRISVWYPAIIENESNMLFETFVKAQHEDPYFSKLNEVMTDYDMWSYKGMFKKDKLIIEKFMKKETNVFYNAKPIDESFPLIVYSSGWFSRSPDNILMAEYLASRGYIIISVPQLGTGSTIFDFKVTEDRIQTQVDDLKFALDFSIQKFNVDQKRITSVGFSIGGIVALWLAQLDERIDAVIGLDGSYIFKEWAKLSSKGHDTKNKTFPIITFHRGHEKQLKNVDYRFIEQLNWSDRIIFNIPKSTHGEFYDEPYLINLMKVPWVRPEFNTMDEAFLIHVRVIMLMDRLLSMLADQEIDSNEIAELRDSAEEYSYIFNYLKKRRK